MNKNNIKLGIMSGRLSESFHKIQEFPFLSWKREFLKAEKCGFDTIEWIFDNNPNPIMNDEGLKEIKKRSHETGIKVISLIGDFFMDKMLFNVSKYELEKNIKILQKLIIQCHKLDIEILELPFVDSSSLKTEKDQNSIVENLEKMIELAYQNNVKITFETDLHPIEFKRFLEKFDRNIGANYDTGNSAALGYDVKQEIDILKPWLTNIHIKDRILNGETVPLGQGNTDFERFFSVISNINYNGQLIIQGAREKKTISTPEITCKKYLKFVKGFMKKYDLISLSSMDY